MARCHTQMRCKSAGVTNGLKAMVDSDASKSLPPPPPPPGGGFMKIAGCSSHSFPNATSRLTKHVIGQHVVHIDITTKQQLLADRLPTIKAFSVLMLSTCGDRATHGAHNDREGALKL